MLCFCQGCKVPTILCVDLDRGLLILFSNVICQFGLVNANGKSFITDIIISVSKEIPLKEELHPFLSSCNFEHC
ncbi:hypothetical protein KP509_37G055600 [Ceratopteris richardii]|uniref:Uncharacterized protein n=1 Tax=Ceratopteris richardii TaxID=49495 RepID=A0A8T2Q8X9_CERRI|nr:hypothetical protein KP509_37G055600 [Ceratopteris richardii]